MGHYRQFLGGLVFQTSCACHLHHKTRVNHAISTLPNIHSKMFLKKKNHCPDECKAIVLTAKMNDCDINKPSTVNGKPPQSHVISHF